MLGKFSLLWASIGLFQSGAPEAVRCSPIVACLFHILLTLNKSDNAHIWDYINVNSKILIVHRSIFTFALTVHRFFLRLACLLCMWWPGWQLPFRRLRAQHDRYSNGVQQWTLQQRRCSSKNVTQLHPPIMTIFVFFIRRISTINWTRTKTTYHSHVPAARTAIINVRPVGRMLKR